MHRGQLFGKSFLPMNERETVSTLIHYLWLVYLKIPMLRQLDEKTKIFADCRNAKTALIKFSFSHLFFNVFNVTREKRKWKTCKLRQKIQAETNDFACSRGGCIVWSVCQIQVDTHCRP